MAVRASSRRPMVSASGAYGCQSRFRRQGSDVESAHFNIAAQAVANLVIDIEGSHVELVNVRSDLKIREEAWGVLAAAYKDAIRRHPQFFKKICTSSFQCTGKPVVHAENLIMTGFSREGRVIRRVAVYNA